MSRRCGCLATWFCYHMIAKPGNKTAAPSWPDPFENIICEIAAILSWPQCGKKGLSSLLFAGIHDGSMSNHSLIRWPECTHLNTWEVTVPQAGSQQRCYTVWWTLTGPWDFKKSWRHFELEQLERLRSEIPPPMITHTSDSHQIPSQRKTKSKLQILQETLHATHLLRLLDKMCKYEMDQTRTVGATERTRDVGQTYGRTDRQTDGRTEWNQYTPPTNLLCGGYSNSVW